MSLARSIKMALVAACAASVLTAAEGAAQAQAAEPWWHVTVSSRPGTMRPGKIATIVLLVTNLGDAPAAGSTQPVTITDAPPSSVEVLAMSAATANPSVKRGPVQCVVATLTCAYEGELPAFESIEVEVEVEVGRKAVSGELDTASVQGGGAPSPASGSLTLAVGGETSFGVQSYQMSAEAEGGAPVTQAGAHPFQLTTTEVFNQDAEGEPVDMDKDLELELPNGLVGNPTAYPQCSLGEFFKVIQEPVRNECPPETALGVAVVTFRLKGSIETESVPLFNLEPEAGEPARFGFLPESLVLLDTSVRTGAGYGVTVSARNITQIVGFLSSQVTFWGVPGRPIHDRARGWGCLRSAQGQEGYTCNPEEELSPAPFQTMPSACSGPMQAPLLVDSWQRPGDFQEYALATQMPELSGCNKERFEPTIKTAPDVEDAATPSGLTVDVHVPQELQTVASATAESAVKQIKVELPQGVTVNPGGAGGLQACVEGEVGYEGKEVAGEAAMDFFSATLPEPFCPKQAKIGTVTIHSPLLPNPLEGAIYLADPAPTGEAGQNPYKSLIAMYLVAEDPVSGTLVKLPMHVELNETTGQVVTTVESPQLPFEEAELHFFGGGRAPLATPGLCGAYTTKAVFTPWSGQEAVTSTSTFNITSGPNGSPCPSDPRSFTPEFNTGTTNVQAGEYSELTTTMGHPDEDQALAGLQMTLPPGLSGRLAGVKLCEEPQAAEGTCGPESLIGHTTVTAGLGSTPAVVARPGNVYITGPYNGTGACKVGEAGCAPFGLSIANPTETGPFDLSKGTKCDCVVVRAKVEVNPLTAALTITTNPAGAYAIPTMLDGIPLDLQHVAVQINRPGFTFNPTSCDKMAITGSLSGSEGASVPISEPFQVANCADLAFKPGFSASTSHKTSRRDGASLKVEITYPKEPIGKDANIKEVKVELPEALPSRLSTLQKACLAATFEADPAGCPSESVVGHAKAITPLLPVPLEGPAYFVSYGGAKFPELVMVLQGYGVTIDLHGETFISKKGVTSSTFKTVPDQPVESFELTLPQGSDSALSANRDLCNAKLAMPTLIVGQNGAVIEQKTKISVSGCKPSIEVVKHSVKGAHAKILVRVPSAGKLTAHGKGVTSVSKKAGKAKTVTVKLSLSGKDRLLLAKHPTRRLKVKVKLSFAPKHGKKISAHVVLLLR